MKKARKICSLILGITLLISSVSGINITKVEADTEYTTLEIEDMQLNKARIKSGDSDSGGYHVETYWQQDPLDSYDKLTDITFARTVFKAEEAGDYTLQIHCKNESGSSSINVKLYVNKTAYDITVSGSSYTTVEQTVTLNAGNNAIVLAWVNWGYFDFIAYPSELTVVNQSTDTVYQAFESALNEVQLAPTNGFHNASSTLYTAPIEYNSGDEEWQGSATFTVDAASDIQSIDLHYYVSEYKDKSASIAVSINGGNEVILDLSKTKTNTELTYSIPTDTLTAAGFKAGKINTIKFRQSDSKGGEVGLYYIELKKESVEEETAEEIVKTRYESEGAYCIAAAQIKSQESDNENWSKDKYVGGFTAADISSASKIDEYCSNIGYIQYSVSAPKAGYYKVTLGYATEVSSMTVYVTSGYKWSTVKLESTSGWSTVDEESTEVYLKKGDNSIWVTGPSSADDWVNYDYIDVEFEKEGTIDTSKAVLFMDSGASASNSKVVSDEEESTAEEDADDEEDSDKETSDTSDTSPLTGVPVAVALLIICLGISIGLIVCGRKKLIS